MTDKPDWKTDQPMRFAPCDLCDAAFHGLIRAKIELAERLRQLERNHDGALRLYSEWRSRAEKAEADLHSALAQAQAPAHD